jgi:hypothetical protein
MPWQEAVIELKDTALADAGLSEKPVDFKQQK